MADALNFGAALTDPRAMLAAQLMQQSADTTPVRSWTQELARALAGPAGAWELNKLNGQRTQALAGIGDAAFGGQPSGQAAAPATDNQPSLLGRIGNAIGLGPSTMGNAAPPSGIVAPAGSPLANQFDSDQGSISAGGTTYGPKFQMPPQTPTGGPAVPQAQPPAPSSTPNPAPSAASPTAPATLGGVPGAPAVTSPWDQQEAYARAMYNQGKTMNNAFGAQLMQNALSIHQGIVEKKAEQAAAMDTELVKQGLRLVNGAAVPIENYGQIKAGYDAQDETAKNPALIDRAAGISHAERGDKIAESIAPEQFKLQTGTQTIQTPNGPTLMTNQQAMDYARNGQMPGGGALQDPKIHDAQVAEITGSQKRFSDAQTRLQNLGQLKSILANPDLITGGSGDELQALRENLLTAYRGLGVSQDKIPTSLTQGVPAAEALKAAANNLAIEVSKDEGVGTPRVSIFNAISQNKPGLSTSPTGNLIRVLSMEQAAKRESDFGNFAHDYYQKAGNFNKQDAESAFAKLNPNSKYTSQIYPATPEERASIPVGQMYVAPNGKVYTKTAPQPDAQ